MYGQKAILGAKVQRLFYLCSDTEENLLKRTHFEVLMPHQSVIMPPIYDSNWYLFNNIRELASKTEMLSPSVEMAGDRCEAMLRP